MSDITGHTPGPWTVDHERIGPWGEPVALLCDSHAPESGTIVEWPRFGEVVDDAENEANARLIAGSPALLEALERLMEWHSIIGGDITKLWFMDPESADEEGIEGLEGTNQVWQQARDAIAKARGGA